MRRAGNGRANRRFDWKLMLGRRENGNTNTKNSQAASDEMCFGPDNERSSKSKPTKWSMGMLNDPDTEEVPGSVLLLSKVSQFNEPLGMRNAPARNSTSSFPQSPRPRAPSRSSSSTSVRRWRLGLRQPEKKTTADGKFVLEPQPDDSANDPLNWKVWRRDAALLSLGFYCMVGGGMTPILAAGFDDVAEEYNVSVPRVALTTGLYMMGLGLGSVVLSPTAILYGKRPVYLIAAICFILSGVWCALSPNFASLVCARIFQGFAVSSVECLPSATVAEIYFLHEKAYRLGIYTLLLLGGKNLVPLVSAAVIQSLGWRWVFWVVAMVVGFGLCLLFFFVPETFWDRSPVPHKQRQRHSNFSMSHVIRTLSHPGSPVAERKSHKEAPDVPADNHDHPEPKSERHAHFTTEASDDEKDVKTEDQTPAEKPDREQPKVEAAPPSPQTPKARLFEENKIHAEDYFNNRPVSPAHLEEAHPQLSRVPTDLSDAHDPRNAYTKHFASQPAKSYIEQLRPWSGRMSHDKWFKVALRPFILFAYPSLLWSALVYSLSIGWLIVLSESVTTIYISRDSYNFTSLQAGLVYISPFVGGVLGTAVAGKVSDVIVRWMARRNGGIYEPEFRLVMAIPIAIFTVIGLMGYGWSAQERDAWIVPTIFFGFISFGCSLGSTTSITFAVDSYRQYAGEALVTLNFSKNILHGLVWSLFFNHWLESDGSRDVFIAIGGIQLACLLTTIPMYIYGKRARMWTVRKNFMEKF
ncbi:Protein HOL1 [Pseudocercospora fuligena]|uniref:Protein HOL1 n=1 Tax=Pseudocercospora fuligena TaxID=685502 RepID=A0A8H6RBT8_9PEZI|nr:Protein HOL1 [Pseudocercospora fuligena]